MVRGWVDQRFSVVGEVERSTGDVRQNDRVAVRNGVAREIRVSQFGLIILRPASGIRSIGRPTYCREDGSPVVVSAAWMVARSWGRIGVRLESVCFEYFQRVSA
jgi:hypothetical protein